jgi:hypothetical protein
MNEADYKAVMARLYDKFGIGEREFTDDYEFVISIKHIAVSRVFQHYIPVSSITMLKEVAIYLMEVEKVYYVTLWVKGKSPVSLYGYTFDEVTWKHYYEPSYKRWVTTDKYKNVTFERQLEEFCNYKGEVINTEELDSYRVTVANNYMKRIYTTEYGTKLIKIILDSCKEDVCYWESEEIIQKIKKALFILSSIKSSINSVKSSVLTETDLYELVKTYSVNLVVE